MSDYRLSAQSREEAGKGSSRRLRRLEGLVPAIVYGGKNAPKSIQLAHKDLKRALEEEAFYSSIITLEIDGKDEPVILKALQRHPAKPVVLHADFQRASANTVLKVHVPVHFLNETTCKGVSCRVVSFTTMRWKSKSHARQKICQNSLKSIWLTWNWIR